jgi:glycine/D-amino acid oxidase-like deaminating enzyme
MELGRHSSIWLDRAPETAYPRLEGVRRYDVAVIGGGITGVTAALLLARAGMSVGLVDQHVVAGGTTGRSTAKVTSQHGITYLRLRLTLGYDAARTYAQAQEAAKDQIAALVADEAIECGFRRRPAYVYASSRLQREIVEREASAARRTQRRIAVDVRRGRRRAAAIPDARRDAVRRPGRVRRGGLRLWPCRAPARGRRRDLRAHARPPGP